MTDLPETAGAFARPPAAAAPRAPAGRDAMPDLCALSCRLARMLEAEIAALEAEAAGDLYSETRVKALMLLAKTLQAMDDMVQRQEKTKNEQGEGPADILEFRNRLARQLEALAAEDEGAGLPGAP